MQDIEHKIEETLEQIRGALRADGGDIELVKFDEKTGAVYVRLQGACVGCPFADLTLKMGVEAALKESLPEITEVIAIEQNEQNL